MFIQSQKITFPLKLNFEIMIPTNQDMIHVPVKVTRVTKSKKFYDGIGVELLKPTRNYLDLVRTPGVHPHSKKDEKLIFLSLYKVYNLESVKNEEG